MTVWCRCVRVRLAVAPHPKLPTGTAVARGPHSRASIHGGVCTSPPLRQPQGYDHGAHPVYMRWRALVDVALRTSHSTCALGGSRETPSHMPPTLASTRVRSPA